MKGKSFTLDPLEEEEEEEEQSTFPANKVNAEIRHKRLGHFNHTAVVNLQRKELIQGLPYLESEIPNCRACQQGKQTRLSFNQVGELMKNCS